MLNVKIATPSEKIFDGQLSEISIKTIDGVMTILPNHVNFISTIENGYVRFNDQDIKMAKGVVILGAGNNLEVIGIN